MNHSGVVESGGRPVPGATVRAILGDVKVITTTDEMGLYSFPDLTPGTWTIEVEIFGFATERRKLKIEVMPTAERWELSLRPRPARAAGQPQQQAQDGFQSIEVRELDAPNEPSAPPETPASDGANEAFLVQGSLSRGLEAQPKQEASEGQTFDWSERILQANAAAQAAGADATGAAMPARPSGRSTAKPSAEMRGKAAKRMAEADAPFGSRPSMKGIAGGGKKSARGVSSRGDTSFGNRRNRARDGIRGSAHITLRDSVFDARPYSLSGQVMDKPEYSYSRFGVTGGGPLKIPKLLSGDTTFFYFDYSGQRSRTQYSAVSTLPTPAERAGDFSQSALRLPVTIYDPGSKQPFPGNAVPASRLNPASLGLLRFVPVPNQPGRVQNYQYVTSLDQNTDSFGFRLNQRISRYDRLNANLNIQKRDNEASQLYGFRDLHDGNGLNADLGWTHNFGPRAVWNVRFNYNRNRNHTAPFFAYGPDIAGELGITGTSRDPMNYGPPNLSFTNFGGLADANPALRRDQTAGVSEGLTLIRQSHSFQLGAQYRRNQINSLTVQNGRGSFSFSGLMTSALDARGFPLSSTGFDFADFLLGYPQSSSIRFGSENTYFRERQGAVWIQDDWKARPNLSLSLGLRWDFFTPFEEKYGRMANLDIAQWFTGAAVVTPGAKGPYTGVYPQGLIEPDRNNLSPRIGIAWRPSKKKHTNVRAGYGIYYNGSIYNQFAVRLASQPPFATAAATLSTSTANPLTIQNGFSTAPAQKITNTYAIDRYYRIGYAQTWSFSIQQELPRAFVLELGYLGTKGTKLDIQRLPNRAPPGSPLTAEQRRQIGNAVGFTYESAEGNSIYNAAQVRLTRRFRKGISANAQYAWGKTIDNASTFGGGGNVVAQNDQDLHAERGLSSFDQRHSLTLNYLITSPVGEGAAPIRAHGWLGRSLKDWTLSGGVTARTGTPLTARVLGNRADSGGTGVVGSGRADATGLPIDGGSFFNTGAFGLPPAGRYGNAGRNTIPGPSFYSLNLAFGRSFRLSERRRVDFRVDSNNFLNHVNYSGLGTVVNSLNYGLPTSATAMRSINATLRFRF